jgi:hypothetical protein
MPSNTTNIGLTKFAGNDYFDYVEENINKDKLDTEIGQIKNNITTISTNQTVHLGDNTKHVTKDGFLQTGLNAELVGGKKATDFATSIRGAKADTALQVSQLGVNDGVAKHNDLTSLQQNINSHLNDYTYQVPSIVGTQIRISKQSNTNRLNFKLDTALSGVSITISLDNGVTSLPLKDVDGVAVTTLDKGFVEVVYDTNFFTYVPKKIIRNGKYDFAQYSTFELFVRFGFDPYRVLNI